MSITLALPYLKNLFFSKTAFRLLWSNSFNTLFVRYNHNPSINLISIATNLFTEINFDYFYFTSSELLKNENFLLSSLATLFRFERTNLNSARAICVCFLILLLVGLVGLEPTTPALSTRCSNQLSYSPAWLLKTRLLCVATPCRTFVLSASLRLDQSRLNQSFSCGGGGWRDRTDDPLLAKQVLSQLS